MRRKKLVEEPMQVLHLRCCGLDVHKDSVVACVRLMHPSGRLEQQVRSFATTTRGILLLGDWLMEHQVTIAAMESTGVYWKPIWNLLEDQIEQQIQGFDARIEQQMEVMSPLAKEAMKKLDEIPGIDQRSAQIILAEIGTDMNRFATADHLASWAGLSPGNNESAGKRKSGRVTRGNRWLKATLCQCAWAASRCKISYFRSQHRRIAARRGLKRATLAVAHSQLCIIYELLKNNTSYQDLGVDYFQRANSDQRKQKLIRSLERLGYTVTVASKAA